MDSFSQAGEAMLLGQEGNRELAKTIAAAFHTFRTNFTAWLSAMPTTLPPTETFRN